MSWTEVEKYLTRHPPQPGTIRMWHKLFGYWPTTAEFEKYKHLTYPKGSSIMDKVSLKEHKRTYTFPNGESVAFSNVVEFSMPGSTHRLKLATGEHVIVAAGWLSITIEGIDDWSV